MGQQDPATRRDGPHHGRGRTGAPQRTGGKQAGAALNADGAPALRGFETYAFEQEGIRHVVYRIGEVSAPPVLVLQELPGIAAGVLGFAERLAAAGFQVHLPWLFGPVHKRTPVRNYVRLCISREFARLATGVTAPVTRWLRALVTHISEGNGDGCVAVIGMCLTGGFAIPLLLHPRVVRAVAAQPAIPFAYPSPLRSTPGGRAREFNVSAADFTDARRRLSTGGAQLLAVRCVADTLCPADKMRRLRDEFPDGLTVREYGTAATRNAAGERPHATYTKEFRLAPPDDPAHYSRVAFDDLLAFLRAGV